MNPWKMIFVIGLFACLSVHKLSAQTQEAQQLLLNWQKLSQLKNILRDMYKGYQVVSEGYAAVKDISEGDFNLHNDFLNKLLGVNPFIKSYKKIADIISYQQKILSEYKTAFNNFKSSGSFTIEEITYLSNVYNNLFNKSLKNLDELLMVITAGTMRMSDDERLAAIDKIFIDMQDKLAFLRDFNNNTGLLSMQRSRENNEVNSSRKLNGITK